MVKENQNEEHPEKESEVSDESEPEFSGEGSSEVEDIPMNAEDDDSFKPAIKVDVNAVAPTRHSLRNVKWMKIVDDSGSDVEDLI